MTNCLLRVTDLAVDYGGPPVLTGVSLTVAPADSVGVVGGSGSGKTTLAATLTGLLPPTARVRTGSVTFDDEHLLTMAPGRLRELRGARIGYVAQDAVHSLNPTMRARDQVAEALAVHGSSRREARRRAVELLNLVQLSQQESGRYPHELSGGQRQRVAIAAAIANHPALLIADEPTTGLDAIVQRRLLALLDDLRQRFGLALLVITHDRAAIAARCDRMLQMRDGELVAAPPAVAVAVDAVSRPAPDAPALLRLSGIQVNYRQGTRFGDVTALHDVNLAVHRGEVLGLIGRSGAGKTTLAHVALGLVTPDRGEVRFDDQLLSGLERRARRARRIARSHLHLIFQDAYDAFPAGARVHRALTEPLAIRGERPTREQLVTALCTAGLDPPESYLDRPVTDLSGGERQRLALARAFVARPSLIMADEPTSMLDPDLRLELATRLRDGVNRGDYSLVLITHDLDLAGRMCDRIAVLDAGRLVEVGPTTAVVTRPTADETRALLAAGVNPSAFGKAHR